ncbi:hypothetical protein KSP40_PGU005779 [Platanthera guangdongensis]|uniref:Uncharacterized protein n=1 Tax=Platanthera guangdongensis TaxID=2320717 RepID=A0ABR2LNB9_9ASPA
MGVKKKKAIGCVMKVKDGSRSAEEACCPWKTTLAGREKNGKQCSGTSKAVTTFLGCAGRRAFRPLEGDDANKSLAEEEARRRAGNQLQGAQKGEELTAPAIYYRRRLVCALSEKSAFGSPLFFGQASSCKADISLKIIEDGKDEDVYDLIFSIGQMIKICKQMDALSFQAVLEQHEHVEMVDGEWTEIKPSSPNSYSLRCSIYSVLNSCSIDKISIMQVYA